jgi:hypothetical protein
MKATIGQRILAAIIAHQLDISADRALKLYVQGREIDPSWDEVGEMLVVLRSACNLAHKSEPTNPPEPV